MPSCFPLLRSVQWRRSCGSWWFVLSHFAVCGYNLSCRAVTSLQNGLNISSGPCSFIVLLTSEGRDYYSSFRVWDGLVIDLTNRTWGRWHVGQLLDPSPWVKRPSHRRGHGQRGTEVPRIAVPAPRQQQYESDLEYSASLEFPRWLQPPATRVVLRYKASSIF